MAPQKWEDSFTRTMNLEMNSVTARADFLVPVDKSRFTALTT